MLGFLEVMLVLGLIGATRRFGSVALSDRRGFTGVRSPSGPGQEELRIAILSNLAGIQPFVPDLEAGAHL